MNAASAPDNQTAVLTGTYVISSELTRSWPVLTLNCLGSVVQLLREPGATLEIRRCRPLNIAHSWDSMEE
jgi:hypothetical protein